VFLKKKGNPFRARGELWLMKKRKKRTALKVSEKNGGVRRRREEDGLTGGSNLIYEVGGTGEKHLRCRKKGSYIFLYIKGEGICPQKESEEKSPR